MTTVDNELCIPSWSMEDTSSDAGSVKIVREKVKGLSHFRILPPYGTNNKRALFKRYQQHWGFIGANGNQQPVACSYAIDRFCPICQKVKDAQAELDRMMGGKTRIEDLPEDQKAPAKALSEYVFKYKVDQVFCYNAVSLDGRVVVLDLKWTSHKNLFGDGKEFDGRLKDVVKKHRFDPTSIRNGVWFTFDKTGKGLATAYPVEIKKTSTVLPGGQIAEIFDRTPLSDDLVARLEAQFAEAGEDGVARGPMFDIHTLMDPMTANQLADILAGKPIPMRQRRSVTQQASAPVNIQTDLPDPSEFTGAAQNHFVGTQFAPPPVSTPIPPPIVAPAQATVPAPPPVVSTAGGLAKEIERLRALQAAKRTGV
jgi:hypothetical protein